MAITLGLSTALSGILTNQKGLDVISQNVVNVNTPGYVRKVMSPESRVVGGIGAGVQTGAIVRSVDEGLMKDIRRQTSTQGALDSTQSFYPRIEGLFGRVGDKNTIANQIQTLQTSFEALSTQSNSSSLQLGAVQSAMDSTSKMFQMTQELQGLRLEADRAIQDTVGFINKSIGDIYDLNQKIVRNGAVGADTGDLQDKRDNALTNLAKYMDIQYFPRSDGAIGVYTPSGKTLVDKDPAVMTHAATTITDPWMTWAGGNFNKVTLSSVPDGADISTDFRDGQMRALLDMRDKVIPNLQAQMDELAQKLTLNINQVHNRGTVFPASSSKMNGTRTFQDPNNPTINGGLIPAALTPSPQKMWLSGNDDTTIAMFDPNGNQIASTTLRTIMQSTSYTDAAGAATSLNIGATPGVKMTDVAAKVQSWMRAQNYQNNGLTNASASISTGKFVIDTGSTSVSLGFRDQTATANGSTVTDARVNFDVDGDGNADQTVSGFANFLGLNDMFVRTLDNSISDSDVRPLNYMTSSARTIRLADPSGQIGNAINIPSGSDMGTIAALINAQTQTIDSATLSSSSMTTTSPTLITVSDANGTISGFPVSVGAGAVTLASLAAAIDAIGGSVQAKAVQDGPNAFQLRIWDSRGMPLTVNISGGALIGGGSVSTQLSMQSTHLINASVVPDGPGYRLRIRQTGDRELYIGATPDNLTPAGSLVTDLGLHAAATRSAGIVAVRTDIQGSPSLMSRGAMQYNSDLDKYYLSEGDNTTTLAIAKAMSDKVAMSSAGDIYAGSYNFAEYAASTTSVVAVNSSHNKDQQSYQSTLGQALDKQYTSFSGVNIDEEVANMINFQQAYSASAKVISTLQEMLDTLVNIIR
ncbi:Flagellar hook-associated protein [Candidatus Terasakiella magnetica]|nr:Flagellar hook-associated protein [Candidatus Terasakiella magnetica]